MFGWLAVPASVETDVDQLIAPLEALAMLQRDLDVRLRDGGVGSLQETLATRDRLLRALGGVSDTELREVRTAVAEMHSRLTVLAGHLTALRRLLERWPRATGA
jgi:hypothetical protein